jgi:hypothetical protein
MFEKLMFNPDILANQSNSARASLRDFSFPSRIKEVSSANCDSLCSVSVTFIPVIFLFRLILIARISAHKMKMYEKSLSEALAELDWFAKISGLNINFSKTQVIWFGSKKYSEEVFSHHYHN